MIRRAINRVTGGGNLSENEMMEVMDTITSGRATPAQIGALVIGLRMKGETEDEITGAARVLINRAEAVPVAGTGADPDQPMIVDTCGTGGDGSGTFNVSTAAALVAAGAGLKVAKHGNRAVSSSCGSADVLEELGINLDLAPEMVGQAIDDIGIGFLFAPVLHSSMKHAAGPRRELGLRTIFNLLGPLTNPVRPRAQVMGVFKPELTDVLARVLGRLGCAGALVVHGLDGCDEISLTGPTRISRLTTGGASGGRVATDIFHPEEAGLSPVCAVEVAGGDAVRNAAIIREVLVGRHGPCRDMVCLNTAGVLLAAGRVESMVQGVERARRAIDSGRALDKLNRLRDFSRRAAGRNDKAA